MLPQVLLILHHPLVRSTLVFDFEAKKWEDPPLRSKRPYPGNHHCAEVDGRKLIILGGLTLGATKGQVYDFDADTWEEFSMPYEAGSASSALINKTIHYCGGIQESIKDTVSTCYSLDISKPFDTWSASWVKIPDMPYGINHAAHCTDGKRFYVIGGRKGRNRPGPSFTYNQVYDPATNTWDGQLKPLPIARGGMGKCVVAGTLRSEGGNGVKVYVFGGEIKPPEEGFNE